MGSGHSLPPPPPPPHFISCLQLAAFASRAHAPTELPSPNLERAQVELARLASPVAPTCQRPCARSTRWAMPLARPQ
eukprot:1617575-Pleurochrysis_carterae.AAC.1